MLLYECRAEISSSREMRQAVNAGSSRKGVVVGDASLLSLTSQPEIHVDTPQAWDCC